MHQILSILYNLLAPIILLGIVALWTIISSLQKKRVMAQQAAQDKAQQQTLRSPNPSE